MSQALIETGKNLLILLGGLAAFGLSCLFIITITGPLDRLNEKPWYRKLKARAENVFLIASLAVIALGLLAWLFGPLISFLVGNG